MPTTSGTTLNRAAALFARSNLTAQPLGAGLPRYSMDLIAMAVIGGSIGFIVGLIFEITIQLYRRFIA